MLGNFQAYERLIFDSLRGNKDLNPVGQSTLIHKVMKLARTKREDIAAALKNNTDTQEIKNDLQTAIKRCLKQTNASKINPDLINTIAEYSGHYLFDHNLDAEN